MADEYGAYLSRIEEEIQRALPQSLDAAWMEQCFGQTDGAVTAGHAKPLLTPTLSLISLGGKRWRPLLLVLTAKASLERQGQDEGCPAMQDAFHLVPLVEFIHTASLIHDDIEDRSDTRRGKPAAYISYGTDVALNAASWLYFQAASCIQTSACPDRTKLALYDAYAQEVRRLHLGQAMDITWHNDSHAEPTPEQYLAMVHCKTGTLASLAVRTALLVTGAEKQTVTQATAAAQQVGAGFQIIDDVINLTTGNAGKKRGDDIVEGKKSLPVLLFTAQKRSRGESGAISSLTGCLDTARKDGIESSAVEEAIALLDGSGAIDLARKQGISLIEEGCGTFATCFGQDNSGSRLITGLFRAMVPAGLREERNG